MPGLSALLFLIIVAVVVITGLCLCFGRKQGLKCCYRMNTKGGKAEFKVSLLGKHSKPNNKEEEEEEEEAIDGPTNHFTPTTVKKKSRKSWRPICCHESVAEKKALHALKNMSVIFHPAIDYTNVNSVYSKNEIDVSSDDVKDSPVSLASNKQNYSSAEITGVETCI